MDLSFRGSRRGGMYLLFPTTTEGPVELDDGKALVQIRLSQSVLGGEELLLSLQDFVVARFAGGVALGGNFYGIAVGGHGYGLLGAHRFQLLSRYESVGNFLESVQRSQLVAGFSCFPRGNSLAILAVKSAALEDRAAQVGGDGPK